MTPPTNPPPPRRYCNSKTGREVHCPVCVGYHDNPPRMVCKTCAGAFEKYKDIGSWIVMPPEEHARLLTIEAAARNAMDNSWHIDTPHPDCVCHDWRGCTVLDDKDAQELKEALTPAAPGDKGE